MLALTPGDGHGEKWLSRMEEAAVRAEELGDLKLAELLRSEVEHFRHDAEDETEEDIYALVRDWVYDNPEITFESLLIVLGDRTFEEPAELLKKYPRLREKFDEAKREVT